MKTIAILSTAGGPGRTTLTAALAVLPARPRRPVLAGGFDPQDLLGPHLRPDEWPADGIGAAIASGAPWHARTWRNDDGVLFVPHGDVPLSSLVSIRQLLADEPAWLATSLAGIGLPAQGVVLIDTPRYPSVH